MIFIILMYALFAISFTIGKALLAYADPMFLTGSRMIIGGFILLGYQYFVARHDFKFQWKHRWLYLQMIIFGIYITYILRFWGLQYLTAAKTSFLYNLSPFLSSLYSYFMFNERLSRNQWIGLTIGCVGLIPILISHSLAEATFNWEFFIDPAEIAILVSVACHSYAWVILRKLVRDKSYTPMMVNGLAMTAGGILALITSFLVEGRQSIAPQDILPFSALLGGVILFSNIICYNLYGHLLKKYSATLLSFAGFLTPPMTAFYSWVLMNEPVTWHFYVSNVIVFFGLYLFYKDELRKQINPEKIQPYEGQDS